MPIVGETITFVAGPSLILVVVVGVGLAIYQVATKQRDSDRTDSAMHQIRRCPDCDLIVGQTASVCRHCKANLPDA